MPGISPPKFIKGDPIPNKLLGRPIPLRDPKLARFPNDPKFPRDPNPPNGINKGFFGSRAPKLARRFGFMPDNPVFKYSISF
jgi:hypothetical protein